MTNKYQTDFKRQVIKRYERGESIKKAFQNEKSVFRKNCSKTDLVQYRCSKPKGLPKTKCEPNGVGRIWKGAAAE